MIFLASDAIYKAPSVAYQQPVRSIRTFVLQMPTQHPLNVATTNSNRFIIADHRVVKVNLIKYI